MAENQLHNLMRFKYSTETNGHCTSLPNHEFAWNFERVCEGLYKRNIIEIKYIFYWAT